MRLGYSDVGALVDLNERDDDLARLRAAEESRRRGMGLEPEAAEVSSGGPG